MLLFLYGCASGNCREVQVYQKNPITKEITETYYVNKTTEEPYEDDVCEERLVDWQVIDIKSSYWLDEEITGQVNNLKRDVLIINNDTEAAYIKFYVARYQDGKEIDYRYETTFAALKPDESTKRFLSWMTEYHPKKSIGIIITNQPKREFCETVTKYKTITVPEKVTETKTVTEEKTEIITKKVCD